MEFKWVMLWANHRHRQIMMNVLKILKLRQSQQKMMAHRRRNIVAQTFLTITFQNTLMCKWMPFKSIVLIIVTVCTFYDNYNKRGWLRVILDLYQFLRC